MYPTFKTTISFINKVKVDFYINNLSTTLKIEILQ